MNNIKSKYIIKQIFSNIKYKLFLKIIIYDKNLQNNIDISLKHYKKASIYEIREKDDVIQKYRKDTNILISEEKYENGKITELKEYKYNKIYLIGTYKSKFVLKGKSLNENGKLIFKGIYHKGLFWKGDFYSPSNNQITGHIDGGNGKVDEYNFEGYLCFSGEYKNGQRISGIEFNNKKEKIYEGNYNNNLRWTGAFYPPEQSNEKYIKDGEGDIEEYDCDRNLVFKGKYKNGIRYQGKGIEYFKENKKIKYDGQYKNGIRNEGIYYNINGYKEMKITSVKGIISRGYLFKKINNFEALFFHGQMKNGYQYNGIQINTVGGFIGEFDNNGNFYKGKYYQGDFDINNKITLFVYDRFKNLDMKEVEKGKLVFEGEFKEGLFYKGKEYKYDQLIYEGEYKEGKYWNGKIYKTKNINDEISFEGVYENGIFKGEEFIYKEGKLILKKMINDDKNCDYLYNDHIILGKDLINENEIIVNEYECKTKKEKNIIYNAFTGTFINNQKYKGKEYNSDNQLIFEGEYKDGQYYIGKEYYCNGIIKYEGEFKNGKYYKGKEYYQINNDFVVNTIKFEGEYKDGERYKGNEYNVFGELIFEGEFKSGLYWEGNFYKYQPNKTISGQIIKGNCPYIELYNIYGTEIFKGELKEGKYYSGKGILEKEEIKEIKDININNPYKKEIKKKIYFDGSFENGNFLEGKEIKEYNIVKPYHFMKSEFIGTYKDGNYFSGKESVKINDENYTIEYQNGIFKFVNNWKHTNIDAFKILKKYFLD